MMLNRLDDIRRFTKGYEDIAKEGISKAQSFYKESIKGKSFNELYDKARRSFTDAALATSAEQDAFIAGTMTTNAIAGGAIGAASSIGQDESMMGSALTGAVLGGAVGGAMERRAVLMRSRGKAASNMAKASENISSFEKELSSLEASKKANTSWFSFGDGGRKSRFNDRIANTRDNIAAEKKILASNKRINEGESVGSYKFGIGVGAGLLAHNVLDGNDPLNRL